MILHYIYDPLCGWCYGAKPLVQAAQQVLPVMAHAGGMMSGANRQNVSPQLRNYVMPHDRRIAEYTGQPFGEAYFEGLLRDHSAVFDSTPPIAAVLAAEAIDGRGLQMLGRLQTCTLCRGAADCRCVGAFGVGGRAGLRRGRLPRSIKSVAHREPI